MSSSEDPDSDGDSEDVSEGPLGRRRTHGKGTSSDSQGGRGDEDGDGLEEYEQAADSQQSLDALQTINQILNDLVGDSSDTDTTSGGGNDSPESTAGTGPAAGTGPTASGPPASGSGARSVSGSGQPATGGGGTGGGGSGGTGPQSQSASGSTSTGETLSPDDLNGTGRDLGIGASTGDVATFAQAVLDDGAIDPKHRDDAGEIPAFPPEEPSHSDRVGGWDEFADDPSVVSKKEPLAAGGYTQSCMTEATLSSSVEGDKAFVTDYDRRNPFLEDPSRARWGTTSKQQQASQVCLYAYTEAMGLKGPDLTHDTDRGYVAMQGVDADGEIKRAKDLGKQPQKYADRAAKVSEDELRDMAAAHLLAGNWDLKADNITVDESGSVHIYDFDRMERTWSDEASVEMKASRHVENKTVVNINEARKEHPDADPLDLDEVGAEAVTDRAVEIATALKQSGHDEHVVNAVEQYARETGSVSHARRVRDNIDMLADF